MSPSRDALGSRRSAAAPGSHRRRAESRHDHRHQHLAAVGDRRDQGHREASQEPPRRGTCRERFDSPFDHGATEPGRCKVAVSCSSRTRRDAAPRGFRAHRGQAAGRDASDRRKVHEPVEAYRSTCPKSSWRGHTAALAAQGRLCRWSTTAPAGRGSITRCRLVD